MAFLRIKRVKGKEYAYLVENKWAKGAKQKVKGYIGRVFRFDKVDFKDFFEFIEVENVDEYVEKSDLKKIVSDLVKWEFGKNKVKEGEFSLDLDGGRVVKSGKNVCIKINEGYLCGHTLKNLVDFKAKVDEDSTELSFRLGRAFVDAGIEVPHELFIGLFEKIKGKEDLSAFEGFYY